MSALNEVVSRMISYYAGDPKRIQHFIKVHSLAKLIGEAENLDADTLNILETAAIVHDIGIKRSEEKYHSSAGNYQELEGPAPAEDLLTSLSYPRPVIDRVCWLVGHHHTYRDIRGIDYQILVEADFLVNIYEDGMDTDGIVHVRDRIFKTETGKRLLDTMYLNP